MEFLLGFSIAAFIAVVSLDTLQQRRHNNKHVRINTRDHH